jgi:hypothetical protein
MPAFVDLSGDEFRKAPSAISIGCMVFVDCCRIRCDSVVCTHIFARGASGVSGAKFRWLLSSWDILVFDFHVEDNQQIMSSWLRPEGLVMLD